MKRHSKLAVAAAATVAIAGTPAASAVAAGGNGGSGGGQAAGHSVQSAQSGQSARSVPQQGGADNEDAREAKAAKITAPQAAAAAEKAQSGTVTSLDLDRDRPGLVWDADVVKGHTTHELVLDAGSGKVLSNHKDADDDGDDEARVPAHLKVSAADAARKAAGHGTVTSVDLDADDDAHAKSKPVWEVEATDSHGKEHKLAVDPHSGKVTQPAADKDDRDDDQGDDEDDGAYDD